MSPKVIAIVIIILIITSCATHQKQHRASTCRYELLVKDINGVPIEGAEVSYIIEVGMKEHVRGKIITESDGRAIVQVTLSPLLPLMGVVSSLKYKISKKGYCTVRGSDIIFYNSDKRKSITLLRPIDFIKPKFLSSQEGITLKANILRFIDLIHSQGLLTDVKLKLQSIDLVEFKGRRYLQFVFKSKFVYNSLRLDRYDIGRKIFDNGIRKILFPLSKYVSDWRLFYGYDLKIIAYTRPYPKTNLIVKIPPPQPIEYRFMIPQSVAQKYKNRDITDQQLLNASIILMDEERIELKLQ